VAGVCDSTQHSRSGRLIDQDRTEIVDFGACELADVWFGKPAFRAIPTAASNDSIWPEGHIWLVSRKLPVAEYAERPKGKRQNSSERTVTVKHKYAPSITRLQFSRRMRKVVAQ